MIRFTLSSSGSYQINLLVDRIEIKLGPVLRKVRKGLKKQIIEAAFRTLSEEIASDNLDDFIDKLALYVYQDHLSSEAKKDFSALKFHIKEQLRRSKNPDKGEMR